MQDENLPTKNDGRPKFIVTDCHGLPHYMANNVIEADKLFRHVIAVTKILI